MKRRFQLLPVSLFAAAFFLLSGYVLGGLQTIAPDSFVPFLFWAVVIGCTGLLAYAISSISSQGMGRLFKFSAHTFLILMVGEICFSLVLLLSDLYRIGLTLIRLLLSEPFLWPERNPLWIWIAVVVFVLVVLLFVYGIINGKYAYRVIKHTLFFEDLPEDFDGFTLTQISDVHAGSFTNAKAVAKGIALINEQKADLFVFTGDLVNNKAEEIIPWIGHFSQIKAPYGQFSVLGNHDYGDYVPWPNDEAKTANLQRLKDYHAELGFRLLLDEHVTIRKGDATLILAGVENWGLGFGERGNLEKALWGTDSNDFKILLSHDPSHWEAQVKQNPSKINLTLAGHTHGMQFGIEAFGIKWSPVKYRYKHWAGIKKENGRVLNVNRGFGFLGFSGRIGIWPEITVIELRRTT